MPNRLNLTVYLKGEPINYVFNDALDIKDIAITSFATGSPPVPIPKGVYSTYASDGDIFTIEDKNFMSLKDLLANAMGQRDVTFTNSADGETMQIVYVNNDRVVTLYVGETLAALYTLIHP